MSINQNANFAIINCCSNKFIGWSVTRQTASDIAKAYAKLHDCTVAVVFLLNRQVRLFKYDGTYTMWFWPGDQKSTVAVAKDLKRNFLTDVIIEAAYECSMDSEWIKNRLGILYVK
jgi:hypothetical protein